MMNIKQTSIPANLVNAFKMKRMDYPIDSVEQLYGVVFQSAVEFLALVKSTSQKSALVIAEPSGKLKFAIAATYVPNENEDMPGNFVVEVTFDQEDIEGAKVYPITDHHFIQIAKSVGLREFGMEFIADNFVVEMFEMAADTLLQWLDVNATEAEEKGFEVPGFFNASVQIEGEDKLFSIVLDGAKIKKIIKDETTASKDVK